MPVPTLQRIEMYGVRHTYIEYNNAGTIAFKRVWLTNKCDVKVGSKKLTFSGDGLAYDKNYGYQASGSVEASMDDTQLDGIIWATPAVSPLGGDDFSVRYIKGSAAELQTNFVGLRISVDAADADTGSPLVVRLRVLKIQFDPDAPANMQSQTVVSRMLAWQARPAKTDIVGISPSGMPSNGCFWLKDIITDPTKFDPVAGDFY